MNNEEKKELEVNPSSENITTEPTEVKTETTEVAETETTEIETETTEVETEVTEVKVETDVTKTEVTVEEVEKTNEQVVKEEISHMINESIEKVKSININESIHDIENKVKQININESIHDIEDKVKTSSLYGQVKEMFMKIKANDYAFELSKRDKYIILGIILGVIIFDQVTKVIAANLLMEYESYEIIDNFFYFTFVYNPGMAWGTFAGARWGFVLITPIILLCVLYFFVYSKKHEILTRGGMILIFAGAIGNWIDRLLIGEVRDFIHFIIPIIDYDFPVFNIADIAVVMGMGLVLLEIIIQEYQIWKLSKSL